MADQALAVKQMRIKSRKFDPEGGIFEGYAAVFGNVDSDGELIEPGAFAKFLEDDWSRVKILALHNDEWLPIGKPIELYEDDIGLYIKAKIIKTGIGADVWNLLVEEVLDELSIGYVIIKAHMVGNVQHLTELELQEVSVVTWAANEKAKILKIKSRSEMPAPDLEGLTALAGLLEQQASAIRKYVDRLSKGQAAVAARKAVKSDYRLPPTVRSGSKHKTASRTYKS